MLFLLNQSSESGDALLSISMAHALKDKYPDCKVVYLVSNFHADAFKRCKYIDQVLVYHRRRPFYHKIREIIRYFGQINPTHYFYVGGGYLPNFMSWLLRIPFRGGLKSKWHTYLFLNEGLRQKRSMVTMHEMEYDLNLLSSVGIEYHYEELQKYIPSVRATQDDGEMGLNFFNKILHQEGYETDRKMIFIHPGLSSTDSNWPLRNYGRFIQKIEQKFPHKFLFIVTYYHGESEGVQAIKEILGRKVDESLMKRVYYLNKRDFGESIFIGLLSLGELCVGPRSGVAHLAALLGTPVICLYSPIKNQSSMRFKPLSTKPDKVKVLVPDVICGEVESCALRECPYYECMGRIEVEDVYQQALKIMEL